MGYSINNFQNENIKNRRKNLRLKNFDYSLEGAYFITIVTQNRKNIFGSITEGVMVLSEAGKMVDAVCQEMPHFIPDIAISSYQIMPNHIHAVVEIITKSSVGATLCGCPGQTRRSAPTKDNHPSLGNVIQRFKSLTTRRYIDGILSLGWPRFARRLWQRNYYEHVIRDEKDYQEILDYIYCNPQNWEKDDEYHNS
jgi:REP element-mobilizing transposase RayT